MKIKSCKFLTCVCLFLFSSTVTLMGHQTKLILMSYIVRIAARHDFYLVDSFPQLIILTTTTTTATATIFNASEYL